MIFQCILQCISQFLCSKNLIFIWLCSPNKEKMIRKEGYLFLVCITLEVTHESLKNIDNENFIKIWYRLIKQTSMVFFIQMYYDSWC